MFKRTVFLLCLLAQSCCHIPFEKLNDQRNFSTGNKQIAIVDEEFVKCQSKDVEVILNCVKEGDYKTVYINVVNLSDSPILFGDRVNQIITDSTLQILSEPDFLLEYHMGLIVLKKGESIMLEAGKRNEDLNRVDLDLYLINNFQSYMKAAEIQKSDFSAVCQGKELTISSPLNRYPDKGFTKLLIRGVKFDNNIQGEISYSFQDY